MILKVHPTPYQGVAPLVYAYGAMGPSKATSSGGGFGLEASAAFLKSALICEICGSPTETQQLRCPEKTRGLSPCTVKRGE
jgi:hypothetical protein